MIRSQMRKVTRAGRTFNVTDGLPFWTEFQGGAWEPATITFLSEHTREGSVMLDIGAWIGPITLFAAVGGTECHCFEPDPIAFQRLKDNVGSNDKAVQDKIHLNHLAVTRTGEPIQLFKRYNFGDSGSSMLERVKDSGESVKVGSVVLEEYIRSRSLERIDLIKMDVEGGEFDLLPSIAAVLDRFRPILFLALHLPYLIEHAEKALAPSGFQRRIERFTNRIAGRHELYRAQKKALELSAEAVTVLRRFPFIYTAEMIRVSSNELDHHLQDLTELIFSYRALQ